jgi:predicted nucleic acid-binding protein
MPATKKKRTYLDTGVLFAAFRGEPDTRIRALTVLSDPAREFVTSDYLRLEMLPKAIFFGNQREREFYEEYFDCTVRWAHASKRLMKLAYEEVCATGLAALDALHVSAATVCGAVEMITTELPTKPMYRTKKVTLIHLLSL